MPETNTSVMKIKSQGSEAWRKTGQKRGPFICLENKTNGKEKDLKSYFLLKRIVCKLKERKWVKENKRIT